MRFNKFIKTNFIFIILLFGPFFTLFPFLGYNPNSKIWSIIAFLMLTLCLAVCVRPLAEALLNKRKTEKFIQKHLGDNYRAVKPNVKRSFDGRRQLRAAALFDVEENYSLWNLDLLASNGVTIIESNGYVVPFAYFEDELPQPKSGIRLIALVKESHAERIVSHFATPPPQKGSEELRELLASPHFLAIQQIGEGFLLTHFDTSCFQVGETWHQSLREAKEQAAYEYGTKLSEWKANPRKMSDCRDVLDWLRHQKLS